MGNWLCKPQKIKMLFIGLEGVGKTSLMYHLKLGEVIHPIPTLGPNIEDVDIDGVEVNLCDVSSRGSLRTVWRLYYPWTNGIVFVIDSTCERDFEEAVNEFLVNVLHFYLYGGNRDAVFMVIANKQDLPGAKSAQEIEDCLLKRMWKRSEDIVLVVPCSALDVQQVSQIFTFFTHLICLNLAGKLKRGFITLKEQKEIEEKWKESTLKMMLKNPVDYMRSLF